MNERNISLDELNLRTIVVTVLKNFWVLVLLCASVLLCYTGYAKLSYQPVYTASATLMVSYLTSLNPSIFIPQAEIIMHASVWRFVYDHKFKSTL